MMYYPLRVHSDYSLLLSTLKPGRIAEICEEKGYKSAGLTDFTSISGAVDFYKECKEHGVKPILGAEIIIGDSPEKLTATITLLCKNLDGWKTLVNLISDSNDTEHVLPHITLEQLKTYDLSNFVAIDGYLGSVLNAAIVEKYSDSFVSAMDTDIQDYLYHDWLMRGINHVSLYSSLFKHYYLEFSNNSTTLDDLITSCVTDLSRRSGVKMVNDNAVYYNEKLGAFDQRVLLSAHMKCVLSQLESKISKGQSQDKILHRFLYSAQYGFMDYAESDSHVEIDNLCEAYDILSDPKIPHFSCPDDQSEIDYLTSLCRIGWRTKLVPSGVLKSQSDIDKYAERVKYELDIVKKAKLSGYFLIVRDYVNHFRKQNVLVGPGRGSAAGCLISYLLGITLIDPLLYDLSFTRFYNPGRISEGKISLPDIDMDFPPEVREQVIEYITDKYGPEYVCQMVTFGRLQGKSALKEVLRINDYCSFDEMNQITSKIPSEAAISDLIEESGVSSILMWVLEYDPDSVKDYCRLEDGVLVGDYARAFEQAIRLEGVFKSQGKHAAGLVISSEKLSNICPMVRATRSSKRVAGFEMGALEAVGGMKVDILGLMSLQKVQKTCEED